MKGTQRVSGVVMKEYIESSFTGTPTRNYIVMLNGDVKCFVYSKMSSTCLFKTGDNVEFTARFGGHFNQNFVCCRGVKDVVINKTLTNPQQPYYTSHKEKENS